MTLPQVQELLDYWRTHPPIHLLVGAALRTRSPDRLPDDFAALAALAPDGTLQAKGQG